MVVASLTLARQCNTCLKNIYSVSNILLHSVTIGIFEAMLGDACTMLSLLPACLFNPAQTTSMEFLGPTIQMKKIKLVVQLM